MEIFFEIHKDIPREGPGSNESTLKAFKMLEKLPKEVNILDIGCGPGMQTLELARNIQGTIVGVDMHEPFIEKLLQSAKKEGLEDIIKAQKGSMFELDYAEKSFDILWSEGAIFIIGFERGLREWKKYIKTEGYLVVSEISWIRKDIPDEPRNFWEEDYPSIKGIGDNIKIIEELGYEPVGHFILPQNGWWDYYYNPLIERIEKLREIYKGNKEANLAMDNTMKEIELYRKYADYYGYVFYIMKNIE